MEDQLGIKNIMASCCPQCKKSSTAAANRLVRDSCGHQKCRVCLLMDEDKCRQCHNTNNVKKGRDPAKESVIKYEGVITCNGTAKDLEPTNKTGEAKKKRAVKNLKKHRLEIPSHITVTKDPVLYKCNICNKQFATKYHIKFHVHCTGVPKPFRCNQCSKEFITRTHLQIHSLGHSEKKHFSCNSCQKAFADKYKLKRHQALHSSVKPFVCSECGKSFRAKDSLKLHALIHRGEKPYTCRICSAKFNNPSNLNKHLISHSKEKDHMCDQCGKRFKLKWSLTVHRRSHQRLRPHECNNCYKTFINNKDLQRHQLIHLERASFVCSFCPTSFRRKDNLYRHTKNSHPGKRAVYQKTVKQLIEAPKPTPKPPADNPNAIKVITSVSPLCKNNPEKTTADRSDNRSVIIGPLKLAFKTTAFKNSYNINREYNLQESVNICQKILGPERAPSPPARTIIKKAEPTSTEICQKILGPYTARPHYETSFEHKKHAIIKNIKFKLPPNYTNLVRTHVNENSTNKAEIIHSDSKTYAELKTVSTSVIVNSQMDPSNMHWRRRTSQNLSLKMD